MVNLLCLCISHEPNAKMDTIIPIIHTLVNVPLNEKHTEIREVKNNAYQLLIHIVHGK